MSFRRFFGRSQADDDHAAEFRAHLDHEIEENIARGMPPAEAHRTAALKFGNSTHLREEVYTMNRIPVLETLVRDLRYAARMLRRSPGFTAAAVMCLALGIGATTAIFSVVYTVLLRPLPYAHSEQLLRVYAEGNATGSLDALKFWLSGPELFALKREARSFELVDGWLKGGANITGAQEPFRPVVGYLTGGLMEGLGVNPVRGRLLTPADDEPSAPLTAVLAYSTWQGSFGGDESIIGRDIFFSGRKCTIVGVMPPGFQFPPGDTDPPALWTAFQLDPVKPGSPFSHYLNVVARLKPGVGVEGARGEMTALVKRLDEEGAAAHFGLGPGRHRVALVPLQGDVVGGARTALLILLGAVAFVLLIACVNVANLLLARAESRRREIAVRKAIGAGLGTLARQFVTEGVLLSLAGSVVGLAIAFGGIRALVATQAGNIPRASEIGINWTVLGFTLALSFLTGIAFGLAPVAHVIASNLQETLRASNARTTATPTASRFRRALAASELALALVLLIGTGLMIRAFWRLQQVDIGLNPHHVLTLTTTLPSGLYPQKERVTQFWSDLQQRVSVIPGVVSVSMVGDLPPVQPVVSNTTPIEGWRPSPDRPAMEIDFFQIVGPRYFETMGIPLIEGRFFDERDGPESHVVIINQTLARIVFGNASALGHRMQPNGPPTWYTIVGVVGDVKNNGLEKPAGTEMYRPFLQEGGGSLRSGFLTVRTNGNASAMAGPVRAQIRSLDASLPISKVRELDDVISAAESRPRLLTVLLSVFAGVALVLAAIGTYGVISYSVTQRTNEFGIRLALGAERGDILGIVLGQGLRLAVAGLLAGAIGALLLTRFLSGVLFGISAVDPLTFATMAGVLAAVTVIACYIPARRATKVDPVIALRYE
jgi:putative ABC transport system permease protein